MTVKNVQEIDLGFALTSAAPEVWMPLKHISAFYWISQQYQIGTISTSDWIYKKNNKQRKHTKEELTAEFLYVSNMNEIRACHYTEHLHLEMLKVNSHWSPMQVK